MCNRLHCQYNAICWNCQLIWHKKCQKNHQGNRRLRRNRSDGVHFLICGFERSGGVIFGNRQHPSAGGIRRRHIMEPRHALRAGAAACPAVEAEGLTGNTARGKAFQGGHIRLIIALRAVGVEKGAPSCGRYRRASRNRSARRGRRGGAGNGPSPSGIKTFPYRLMPSYSTQRFSVRQPVFSPPASRTGKGSISGSFSIRAAMRSFGNGWEATAIAKALG